MVVGLGFRIIANVAMRLLFGILLTLNENYDFYPPGFLRFPRISHRSLEKTAKNSTLEIGIEPMNPEELHPMADD